MLKFKYLDFILYKTYADLKAETATTHVGFLWWIIDPMIMMGVFYLVFGVFLHKGTVDYVPFLMIGVAVWQWFSTTVPDGARTISKASALMGVVYVPKAIFPAIAVLMGVFKFAVVLAVLIVFLLLYGIEWTLCGLALPLIVLVQLLFTVGVTFLCAAVVPFFPDLNRFVNYGLRLLFFLSGVFFDPAQLPPEVRSFFFLNPMAGLIDGYRNVLLRGLWPDWEGLGIISLFSAALVTVAFLILICYDRVYPKVVM